MTSDSNWLATMLEGKSLEQRPSLFYKESRLREVSEERERAALILSGQVDAEGSPIAGAQEVSLDPYGNDSGLIPPSRIETVPAETGEGGGIRFPPNSELVEDLAGAVQGTWMDWLGGQRSFGLLSDVPLAVADCLDISSELAALLLAPMIVVDLQDASPSELNYQEIFTAVSFPAAIVLLEPPKAFLKTLNPALGDNVAEPESRYLLTPDSDRVPVHPFCVFIIATTSGFSANGRVSFVRDLRA